MRSRFYTLNTIILFLFFAFRLFSCQQEIGETEKIDNPFSGPSPWPEIRKERIQKLLPEAMKTAKVDAWVIICRKITMTRCPPYWGENAGGTALFFYLKKTKKKSAYFHRLEKQQLWPILKSMTRSFR